MAKKLEEMKFEELAEEATRQIHLALLSEGGKGLYSAVYMWLGQAIIWKRKQKEEKR